MKQIHQQLGQGYQPLLVAFAVQSDSAVCEVDVAQAE
jgi:hypothetical protein